MDEKKSMLLAIVLLERFVSMGRNNFFPDRNSLRMSTHDKLYVNESNPEVMTSSLYKSGCELRNYSIIDFWLPEKGVKANQRVVAFLPGWLCTFYAIWNEAITVTTNILQLDYTLGIAGSTERSSYTTVRWYVVLILFSLKYSPCTDERIFLGYFLKKMPEVTLEVKFSNHHLFLWADPNRESWKYESWVVETRTRDSQGKWITHDSCQLLFTTNAVELNYFFYNNAN